MIFSLNYFTVQAQSEYHSLDSMYLENIGHDVAVPAMGDAERSKAMSKAFHAHLLSIDQRLREYLSLIDPCAETDTSCGSWTRKATADANKYFDENSIQDMKHDTVEFEKNIMEYWKIMLASPSKSIDVQYKLYNIYTICFFNADPLTSSFKQTGIEAFHLQSYLYLLEIERWPADERFRNNFALTHFNFFVAFFQNGHPCDTMNTNFEINAIDFDWNTMRGIDTTDFTRKNYARLYFETGSNCDSELIALRKSSDRCRWFTNTEYCYSRAVTLDCSNVTYNYDLGLFYYNLIIESEKNANSGKGNAAGSDVVICERTLTQMKQSADKYFRNTEKLKPGKVPPTAMQFVEH